MSNFPLSLCTCLHITMYLWLSSAAQPMLVRDGACMMYRYTVYKQQSHPNSAPGLQLPNPIHCI